MHNIKKPLKNTAPSIKSQTALSSNVVKKIKIDLSSMPNVDVYSDMPIKRKTSSFNAVIALCLLTLGLLVGISISCIIIFFAA